MSDDSTTGTTTSAKRVVSEDAAAPTAKQPRAGRIVVNVGGKGFTTTVQTLTNAGNGYFAALLGTTGITLGADDDEIFVDRSAELFEYVLHWLRTHTLPAALKRNVHLLSDVMNEAEYFGLDDMSSACQEAVPLSPRSFSLKVGGRLLDTDEDVDDEIDGHPMHANKAACWCGQLFELDGMPKLNPGEVTYIHSVVLTGDHTRLARLDSANNTEYGSDGCFLQSGRKCVDGDFQLQYMRAEHFDGAVVNNDADFDIDNVFVLAHRGLDDAAAATSTGLLHDINFREVLDLVIDGPILLRSVGIGDWHVHGWVGRLEDIPRHSAGTK